LSESKISTFKKLTCPTCNSGCGLLLEVKDNIVIDIKPDRTHPLSRGFYCPKGLNWHNITNSKDRVKRPLLRKGDQFHPISWKQALQEIATKLLDIQETYSPHAIAYYMGTNSLQHYAHGLYVSAFLSGLGSASMYNAGSVDNNNHFVAQYFLYGNPIVMPIPDLTHTDLFIIIGSNPAVTQLSLAMCSNINKVMRNILARGGEIIVIDPRKNKTAHRYANDSEHYIPILPNTDIFLLLTMINIIFQEQLEDPQFLQKHCLRFQNLQNIVHDFTPALASKVCAIPEEKIYQITRKFATTKRAVIYGRMGLSAARWSTLNAWSIEVLNIITGKLDRPGGKIFGKNIINVPKMGKFIGMGSYNTFKSRVGNYPEVMGGLPLGTLAREILKGNIRALFISGGNPLISSPNSNEFRTALNHLELCVVLDFFINESAYTAAHYILPVTTPLENSNFHAIYNLNYQLFPNIQYSEAAVTPEPYGPKPEWEILWSLMRIMGIPAFGNKLLDRIHHFYQFIKKKWDPAFLIRVLLFLGQVLQGKIPHLSSQGVTFKKLLNQKVILFGKNAYGVLNDFLFTKDKKITLLNPSLEEQIVQCKAEFQERVAGAKKYQLRENEFFVIGRRFLKTSNSYFHNVPPLWPNKEVPPLWMNPADANRLNLHNGDIVKLENAQGSIIVPLKLTTDIMAGVVCYPHGWGHKNPFLSFANQHSGANINQLTPSKFLDPLCGMPIFNGYKVTISRP